MRETRTRTRSTSSKKAKVNYIADLFILGQVDEHGDEVGLEVLDLHHLGELAQLAGGRAPHHRGVVLAKVAELTPQLGWKKKKQKVSSHQTFERPELQLQDHNRYPLPRSEANSWQVSLANTRYKDPNQSFSVPNV